jgi:hypothetical protein
MPVVEFLDADIATWIAVREIPPRTDGPHVSSVIVSMLKTAMPDKFAHYGQAIDGERKAAFEIGYTWEDVLSAALKARQLADPNLVLLDAGEIERDGIYGTPDRVLWDHAAGTFVLEEMKATWYSSGGLDADPAALLNSRKFLYWCQQLKTYGAMLLTYAPDLHNRQLTRLAPGARLLTPPMAHVRALFLNGDYKYGRSAGDSRAQPKCWRIRWSVVELEQWWAAVVRHKDRMQAPEPETPTHD